MIRAIAPSVAGGRCLPAQIAAIIPARATPANRPSASRPIPVTLPGA